MKTKFVYLSILLAFSLSGVNAAVPDCQSVVIGSGVAGMKAAMDLKDGGNKVCLIEKMPFPGGATNLAATYFVNFQRFPTLDAKKLVNAPKMSAHHRGICHF